MTIKVNIVIEAFPFSKGEIKSKLTRLAEPLEKASSAPREAEGQQRVGRREARTDNYFYRGPHTSHHTPLTPSQAMLEWQI